MWVEMEAEKQAKMALYLDPVLTEYSMQARFRTVNDQLFKLKAIRKPVVKKDITANTTTTTASEENKEDTKQQEK